MSSKKKELVYGAALGGAFTGAVGYVGAKALTSMSNGQSSGPDSLPLESITLAGGFFAAFAAHKFLQGYILGNKAVPRSLKDGVAVGSVVAMMSLPFVTGAVDLVGTGPKEPQVQVVQEPSQQLQQSSLKDLFKPAM